MSTNKHATIRYNTLDNCFRNSGRKYSIENLIDECNKAIYDFSGIENGIKKRQLYDDIKFMESEQGWNIELSKTKSGRIVYYSYENPKFSISNQPINETEANQLKEAILTLNRFKGLPQFEWINELGARLESSFKLKPNNELVISFEQNEFLKGLNFIPELYNAIIYKRVLKIKYKNFKSSDFKKFTLSPYYLKQYNMRWFLFAKSTEFDNLTNLALDRIEKIEETDLIYENTKINFDEYFDDVIGVSISPENVETIILKVDESLMPYITTKPLHGSQKLKAHENEIHLKLIPNYELETLLLSFGEKIKVLQPLSLSEKLKIRIDLMKNNY